MTDEEAARDRSSGAASLEPLTGPSRGTVTWFGDSAVDISIKPDRSVHVGQAGVGEPVGEVLARLSRSGSSYTIQALASEPIWVNRVRKSECRLEHRDVIEFGETGPISRFRIYGEEKSVRWTADEILSDALAYLRTSRQPIALRMSRFVVAIIRRLALDTTVLFRIGVLLAIIVLAALAYQQNQLNILLQERVDSDAMLLESFAAALARANEEALTPADFQTLRQELASELLTASERLSALERLSVASARVIAEAASSVAFLQGAYGFRDSETDRMLRRVLGKNGQPQVTLGGIPLLSLDGEGPVAERHFTGTAFAVLDTPVLVTNRHVALPWEDDASTKTLAGRGLAPVMTRFIAYWPGSAEPDVVELNLVSTNADLVILSRADGDAASIGLRLAVSSPKPGDEIVLMGYPTGLRSMLAQAGDAFVEELQEAADTNLWSVAKRLAQAGHIVPLASRGIVGRVSAGALVYDAETTHGGSGGPVLNTDGAVIGVSAAIVPGFGGSNIGIPVRHVRELLEAAKLH